MWRRIGDFNCSDFGSVHIACHHITSLCFLITLAIAPVSIIGIVYNYFSGSTAMQFESIDKDPAIMNKQGLFLFSIDN